MLVQIFFSGSQPTSDVTLLLVHIQNLAHFTRKPRIQLQKTLRTVFMHRTLADPKLFRRLSHCCLCFHNIPRDLHRSFFDIIFHKKASEDTVFTVYAKAFSKISFFYLILMTAFTRSVLLFTASSYASWMCSRSNSCVAILFTSIAPLATAAIAFG